MDNALFLDLEFVRGLHNTLLPRPGQVISGKQAKGSLATPMGFKIVPAGHWLWLATGLGPFHLFPRRPRRSGRSLESFEENFEGSLEGA